MLDLAAADLAEVRRILARHVPECEVRAFGSRVSGHAARFSDLDLAVIGRAPLDATRIEALRGAISASDLPIAIEVLDWHETPERLREQITELC